MAKKATFEESLHTLEKLVERLEGGDLSLDEALDCFEQGVKTVQMCRQALERVETRISLLLEEKDGSLQTRAAPEL